LRAGRQAAVIGDDDHVVVVVHLYVSGAGVHGDHIQHGSKEYCDEDETPRPAAGQGVEVCPARPRGGQSSWILADWITSFQRATSSCWKAANASGVLPTTSKPRPLSVLATSSCLSVSRSASERRFTTSSGVSLGTAKPCQE